MLASIINLLCICFNLSGIYIVLIDSKGIKLNLIRHVYFFCLGLRLILASVSFFS